MARARTPPRGAEAAPTGGGDGGEGPLSPRVRAARRMLAEGAHLSDVRVRVAGRELRLHRLQVRLTDADGTWDRLRGALERLPFQRVARRRSQGC